MMTATRHVNYGNGIYDPEKWVDIKNYSGSFGWIKPETGGLWSSPVDSEWGWKDWCKAEDFNVKLLEGDYFEFSLCPGAKIYKIDDEFNLRHFKYCHLNGDIFPRCIIDFEQAAKEYDAIFLSEFGERSTRYSDPFSLYGWDCETLLVLRKEAIIDIKNYEQGI